MYLTWEEEEEEEEEGKKKKANTSVKKQSNLENTWTRGCSKPFKTHSEKLLDYRGLIILYVY